MDCRNMQTLLTAFHDGELPDADRARAENHLRGCPECGKLLADLARADEAAGVPDPGPGYWDRFNVRVAERIDREAEGPGVTVLRPKRGWMREQFRFLVPAVAAAVLVVLVVRYGGQYPVAPKPTLPPAASVQEQAAPDSAQRRMAKPEHESPAAGKAEDAATFRSAPAESNQAAAAPVTPPPAIGKERIPTEAREEKARLAAPSEGDAPSPPPRPTVPGATVGSPPATVAKGVPSDVRSERKKVAGFASPPTEPKRAASAETAAGMKADHATSPCETARTLAAKERFREAEVAQRECLEQDPSPPAQEKGLVFLAELLDRQARFAEADAVLAEIHRQFPGSLPLDHYRQQRPMVQKRQSPVPAIR